MAGRPLARRIRWLFITILCVAVAAGCAAPEPDLSDAPMDLNEDGDRDGVPDGKSPNPGAPQPDTNTTNSTTSVNATG